MRFAYVLLVVSPARMPEGRPSPSAGARIANPDGGREPLALAVLLELGNRDGPDDLGARQLAGPALGVRTLVVGLAEGLGALVEVGP